MGELITEEHICNAIFNSCDVSRTGRVSVSTLIEEIHDAVSSPEVDFKGVIVMLMLLWQD